MARNKSENEDIGYDEDDESYGSINGAINGTMKEHGNTFNKNDRPNLQKLQESITELL